MLKKLKTKYILFYCFSIFLLTIVPAGVNAQDTLRTYGPRFGIDLSRFAYLLADPMEIGAEASIDVEVYNNIYPVAELGYSQFSFERETYDYSSGGVYGRFGVDYNLLPVTDRSVHHSITLGGRYGYSYLKHRAENIVIADGYWGDYWLDLYSSSVHAHWFSVTGGVKTELASNFFMGWNVRYSFLISGHMDEVMTPYIIPGYGKGTENRAFGINYWIMYKIPLLKR